MRSGVPVAAPTGPVPQSPEENDAGAPPPPVPVGMTVRGGVGGTAALLEDMLLTAASLETVATALDDAARAAAAAREPVTTTSAWSPATAAAACDVLEGLCAPGRGLASAAADVAALAAGLREAVELYTSADSDVAALLRTGARTGALLAAGALGEAGPIAWVTAGGLVLTGAVTAAGVITWTRLAARLPTTEGFLLRAFASGSRLEDPGPIGFLARTVGGPGGLWPEGFGWPSSGFVEGLVPPAAAFLRAAGPGRAHVTTDPVPGAATRLALGSLLLTYLVGTPGRRLTVQPVVQDRPEPATEAPRTAAALMQRTHELYPTAGGQPGTVSVYRYEHPDHSASWAVCIPGTESWSPVAGEVPPDLQADLVLMSGAQEHADLTSPGEHLAALDVVLEAMEQIPPGEPVVIVGHSLGGIMATEIASHPEVRERFAITTVVTAGSPTGGAALPPDVQQLSLENQGDVVPTLDGRPNPDARNVTTVLVDPAHRPAGQLDAGNPVAAHSAALYARELAALQSAQDPSVRHALDAVDRVIGDPRATVSVTTSQGLRTAPSPP